MIKKYLKRIRRFFVRIKEKKEGDYLYFVSMPKDIGNSRKLIFVINEAFYGGVPVLSINMIKYYNSIGYSIDVVLLRGGILLKDFYELAPTQVCYTKKELRKVLIKLKEMGYDYAICNGIASSRAVKDLDSTGIEVISLIHELPGVIKQLDIQKQVQDMVKLSKAIIFPSSFGRCCFEKEICRCKAPVFIKHQGLYTISKTCETKEESKVLLAKKYGFDSNKNLIINVATINERKGFDIFAEMAKKDKEAIYFWVGDGIDSKFGNKVREKLGGEFPENLILPGYIKNEKTMANIYLSADCLALTSREEPFGSVVLEAFLYKTPVVAFDNRGGYIDVVKSGKTGALVKNVNADDMIKVINTLCTDLDKYRYMQNECYKVAQNSRFSTYCDFVVKILIG